MLALPHSPKKLFSKWTQIDLCCESLTANQVVKKLLLRFCRLNLTWRNIYLPTSRTFFSFTVLKSPKNLTGEENRPIISRSTQKCQHILVPGVPLTKRCAGISVNGILLAARLCCRPGLSVVLRWLVVSSSCHPQRSCERPASHQGDCQSAPAVFPMALLLNLIVSWWAMTGGFLQEKKTLKWQNGASHILMTSHKRDVVFF